MVKLVSFFIEHMYGLKNNSDIDQLLTNQQYNDIVEIFKSQISSDSTIILALSGWVDSTILFHLLLSYVWTGSIKKEQLVVVHMNHKSRKKSDNEEVIIKDYCTSHWIVCIQSSYLGKKKNETSWRKARVNFFENVIWWNWEWVVFMTGHHLDDRIETSIMNTERGAWIRGKLNMSTVRNKLIRNKYRDILQYVHLRPLLWWRKEKIMEVATTHNVFFLEDISNQDSSLTPRNSLRKKISTWKSWSIQHWIDLYQVNEKKSQAPLIVKKLKAPRNNVDEYYRVWIVDSIEWVQELLDFMWVYRNISSWLLEELISFMTKTSGFKYLHGRYVFRSHGDTYIIKSKNKFRLDDSLLPISQDIDGVVRRNTSWDTRKKKRYKKFLINQKIPVFLRNQLPVVEKNGELVATLYKKDLIEMGVM